MDICAFVNSQSKTVPLFSCDSHFFMQARFWCFSFDSEAREAFVRQFSQLETSAQTLQLQLRSIAVALNCNLTEESEEENKTLKSEDECRELVDTLSAARNMQDQLQKMTNDLNSMVSPRRSIDQTI